MTDLPPWLQNQDNSQQPPQAAQPSADTVSAAPPWLAPDYKPAPAPDASSTPASSADDGYWHPSTELGKYGANALTGLNMAIPTALGALHDFGALGDYALDKMGATPGPGYVTRNTSSAQEMAQPYYNMMNALNAKIGLPSDAQIYKPETALGSFGQQVIASAPMAAIGVGGLPGLATREIANATSTGAADTTHALFPNSPAAALAAGLLGGIGGATAVPTAVGTGRVLANIGGKLLNTKNAVDSAVAKSLVNGASPDDATGVPFTAQQLADTIDQNLPNWQFNNIPGSSPNTIQPAPPTATVAMNPGLANMTYGDMTVAARRNDPTYKLNASQTNQSQRQAVSNVTPDIAPQLQTAQTDLNSQVSALPQGVTAQDAGSTFRQGLQNVYDSRQAYQRSVGSNVYAPLETSNAQISFQPVIDYATTKMASTPGDVGTAYQRALGQFSTASGIRLDTPQFGSQVISSLGDLADSYPKGSAQARAVLDIKNRASQVAENAEPAIGAAKQAYAQASRPLDVFDPQTTPGPIANSVQTTRFGGYTTPNDSVVSQFLTSKAGPDAFDALNSVFPDVKSASQSLQDYIASQVRARAVNSDGSVNQTALATVLKPFDAVMQKPAMAQLQQQFSTLDGAQTAVTHLTARQNLYGTFKNDLGLQAQDSRGVPMYSADAFGKFVTKNQSDLVNAYGQAGADRLSQVNKQLQDAAQIAQSRVSGQSGTSQTLPKSPENILGYLLGQNLGEGAGDIVGAIADGAGGALGAGAAGKLITLATMGRLNSLNAKIAQVTTAALADPNLATNLLRNYNPRQVNPVGQRALNYVKTQLAQSVVAPTVQQTFGP